VRHPVQCAGRQLSAVNLATNEPTEEALRAAVRTVLDRPAYRLRASQMADEFARIGTRSEVLSIIKQVVVNHKLELLAETMTTTGAPRRSPAVNRA
jgi:hypothetical protein